MGKQNKRVSRDMINRTKVSQEKWSLQATDYGIPGSLRTNNPNIRPKAVSNEIDNGNRSYLSRPIKVNSAPRLAADNGESWYRQPSSESAKGGRYQATMFGSSSRDNLRNTSGQKQNKKGRKDYDLRDNIQTYRKHRAKRSIRLNHVDSKVALSSSKVNRLLLNDEGGLNIMNERKNNRNLHKKKIEGNSPQVIIGKGWSVKRRGGKRRSNSSSRFGGPVPISALIPEKIREGYTVFHTAYKDEYPTWSHRGWNSSLIPNEMKSDFPQENTIHSPTRKRSRRNLYKRQKKKEDSSVGAENLQIVKKKRKERRKGSSRKKHKKRSNHKIKRDNLSLNYLDMINPNNEQSWRSNPRKMLHQLLDEECSSSGNENIEESDVIGKLVAERRINNEKEAWRKKNRSTLKNSCSYGGFGTMEPSQMKDWVKRPKNIRSLLEEMYGKDQNSFLIWPDKDPVPDNESCASPKIVQNNIFKFSGTESQQHRKKESDHDEFLAPNENSSKSENRALSIEDVRNERKSMVVLNNGRLWPLPMREKSAEDLLLYSRRQSSSKSKLLHLEQQGSLNLENCAHHKDYHEQENQPKLKKLSKTDRKGKRRRNNSEWKKKPPRKDHEDKTQSRKKHGHCKNISAPPVIREIPKEFLTRTLGAKTGIKEFQCSFPDLDVDINLTKSRKSEDYSRDFEIPSNLLAEDNDRESTIDSTDDTSGNQHIDLGPFDFPKQINRLMSQHNSECSENRNWKNESSAVARDEFDARPTPLNQEEGEVKAYIRNQWSTSAQNPNKWSLILSSSESGNGTSSENYSVTKSDPRSSIAPNQGTVQCLKRYDPKNVVMNNWKSCWDEEWIKQSSREGVKIDFKEVTHDSSSNNHHTSDTEETVVRLVSHSEQQVSSRSRTQITEPLRQHPKQNADQLPPTGVVSRTVSSSWPNAWSQQETSGMLSEEMQPAMQQQTSAKWRILE